MSHSNAFHPRSDQAAPPTMLFSLPAIYPSIPRASVLLHTILK